jgi:hypothetical protein
MKSNLLITFKLSNFITVLCFLLFTFCSFNIINAQATLSVQGILKKSNGVALEDGEYNITFKLYPVSDPPANTALWTETIPDVEVTSGIYSEELGQITPINLMFDINYELGISIGSQEMRPRVKLTSAPYALALRGSTNQFPSSGLVQADKLKVAQGVTVNTGAPLVNNVDGNKGFSFNGDNDTGLFSTQEGEASIYTNGIERLEVKTSTINLNIPTTVKGNVNLENDGGITYTNSNNQSFAGWRLVDVDDFSSGTDGWNAYSPIPVSEYNGWNSTTTATFCHCGADGTFSSGVFVGSFIFAGNREDVFKKAYNIPGPPFSQIKVKFRYIAMDSWDDNDYGFAGFASSASGDNLKIAWYENLRNPATYSPPFLDRQTFREKTQIRNFNSQNSPDMWKDVEISARANGNSFWVIIGSALQAANDENYGIGYVEVWVR